ncbi:MAG: transporter [Steroidobacteraceae bacterium]
MTKQRNHHDWRAACAITLLASSAAGAADLANFVVDLYGGDGIKLSPVTPVLNAERHVPHFTAESLEQLGKLNSAVVSGMGTFAFNSTVTGITFDIATGVPVETENSLGPLLAERATTLGKGKVDLAFGYSHIQYDRLDGRKLDRLVLDLPHDDCCTNGIAPPPDGVLSGFETDLVRVTVNSKLNFDVFGLFANYGVTDRWDIGIVVPVIRVEARASAHAEVLNLSGVGIHSFFTQTELANSRTGGTKTGFGDVILRTKYNVVRDAGGVPDIALLAQVTTPTGDEDNLLGTGETKYKGGVIASKHYGAFAPHLNVAYETTTGEDEADNMTYAAGFDIRASNSLTLGADVLGRWNPDQEEVDDNVVDFALSGKWNPFKGANVPLNAYVIVPVNKDHGLRADVIYGVGFDVVL